MTAVPLFWGETAPFFSVFFSLFFYFYYSSGGLVMIKLKLTNHTTTFIFPCRVSTQPVHSSLSPVATSGTGCCCRWRLGMSNTRPENRVVLPQNGTVGFIRRVSALDFFFFESSSLEEGCKFFLTEKTPTSSNQSPFAEGATAVEVLVVPLLGPVEC